MWRTFLVEKKIQVTTRATYTNTYIVPIKIKLYPGTTNVFYFLLSPFQFWFFGSYVFLSVCLCNQFKYNEIQIGFFPFFRSKNIFFFNIFPIKRCRCFSLIEWMNERTNLTNERFIISGDWEKWKFSFLFISISHPNNKTK